MTIYYLNKKRINTNNLVNLYAGGCNRFWMSKNKKRYFAEYETYNSMEEFSRAGMICMLTQTIYPDRAEIGLKKMGAEDEIKNIE